MALDPEYLHSLGLEIAKKKYYNASRVETVIEELHRRAAQLVAENASLQEKLESLSYGRAEIGEAILSAKTIAQQILVEAQDEADRIVAEAKETAARLSAEAETRQRQAIESCAQREQDAVAHVRDFYMNLREQYLSSIRTLDGEWQRFLRALGEEGDVPTDGLPADLDEKLGAIASQFASLADESSDGE